MLHKLFLPLTITAFLASAAAATTLTTPGVTHFSSQRTANQCAISAQGTGYVYAAAPDALANTAIGRISGRQSRFIASTDLFARRSDRQSFRPYMVAALEMAGSPLADGTPTSCYPPLSFATTSVPQATAGASYSVSLAANGGQPPYSWSFGQSSLPQGFSVSSSGDLTGTPSTAGSYAFNVVVSDSLKTSVTGALTLTVAASSTTPPPTQPPPTQPPPTQPPPTQPPPTQPPPTQPPPTQPPPTQPPPTQPPPTQPPPTQPPPTQPPPTQPPPTQPPPTQPPPSGPPTGTALNSCGDITKGGSYYLANDVSSAGTCFGIDANGVTLNLNGHTITYDTGGTDMSPAIEAHDCWSTTNPVITGPCGTSHGGAEVYGGTIIQAANSTSTFSPVFEFGQSNSISPPPYIHDITATFQNPGAQFYYSDEVPAGAKIENNTIYDNVTSINHHGQGDLSSRAAFQGQAIGIHQNSNNPGTGDLIEGNKIVGSPQGGVYSDNQYTMVSGNDISMNATYSNDFCEAMAADHQTFTNNNCHPKSGRGVHTNANYSIISNNNISVIELKQNAEYGGCEIEGTYGVQVEFDNSFLASPPVGVQVMGNTITATSMDCQANGLRVTDMTPAGNVVFTGNTVTTTNNGNAHDFGISLDSTNNAGVTFTGNTFSDQYAYVEGDWDGYNNATIGHNTWLGTPTYTVYAVDGGCDSTQSDPGAACPVNIQFTDSLANTVNCGAESEATVTIGSQVTQCKPNQ